jgi:hypothetical protein
MTQVCETSTVARPSTCSHLSTQIHQQTRYSASCLHRKCYFKTKDLWPASEVHAAIIAGRMRTSPRGLGQPPFDRLPWAKEEKLVKAPKKGVCVASVCACVPQGTFIMKRWRTDQPKPISNYTNVPKQVCALRAYVRVCHKGTCNMKRWRTKSA